MVHGQEANFSLSIDIVVTYKANKLHIVQVDDLLRLLFIGQIDQNELSVVRCVALIHHQRVVDLIYLLLQLNASLYIPFIVEFEQLELGLADMVVLLFVDE